MKKINLALKAIRLIALSLWGVMVLIYIAKGESATAMVWSMVLGPLMVIVCLQGIEDKLTELVETLKKSSDNTDK